MGNGKGVFAEVKLVNKIEKFFKLLDEEVRKEEEDLRDKSPAMQVVYRMTPVRMRGCKLRETNKSFKSLPKNILVSRIRMEQAKRALWKEKQRKKAFHVLADSESGLKNCLNPDLTLGHKRSLLKSRLAMWECDEVYPFTIEELDARIQEQENDDFQQFLSNCLETPVDGVEGSADSIG